MFESLGIYIYIYIYVYIYGYVFFVGTPPQVVGFPFDFPLKPTKQEVSSKNGTTPIYTVYIYIYIRLAGA